MEYLQSMDYNKTGVTVSSICRVYLQEERKIKMLVSVSVLSSSVSTRREILC